MKKVFLILLICLLLTGLISAAPPLKYITTGEGLTISPNLAVYIKQNESRAFDIHVLNSTSLINSGLSCYVHIYDEDNDGKSLYTNSSSIISDDFDIQIIASPSVHEKKGTYSFKAFCNTSKQAGLYESLYYVTKSGNPPADDIFTAIIYIMFAFVTLGLFYTFFAGLAKLAITETTVYDVLLNWLFYLLAIIVYYISQEYLLRTFIEDLTSLLLTVTVWTNGVFPVLCFIISLFVRSTIKKKPLTVQEIAGKIYG